jgi:hypothetical protein
MASPSAVAQEKDQSWIIKPTEQHKLLKKGVGAWDATVKIWPMAGANRL